MPAGKLNLYIEQGATFARTLTLADDLGAPVDLTGYTFRASARKTLQDVASTFDFTATVTDALLGLVSLTLSAVDTASIDTSALTYPETLMLIWDMEMIETATSEVTRILQGTITVSPEVTK